MAMTPAVWKTVSLLSFISTFRVSAESPYAEACNRTSLEFALTYNSSEGLSESTIVVGWSFPLLVAINGTVQVRDPLLDGEDVSAELNFTLRQEVVLRSLVAVGTSDVATVSYSCTVAGHSCTLHCTLGSYSVTFIGQSAFSFGAISHAQIDHICSRAANATSLPRSGDFHGRWSRICQRMRSISPDDYEPLVFRYENESFVTCDFCSRFPFRFGMWIQRPGRNVTAICPQRADRTVCCSRGVDVGNGTDLKGLRCCVSSSWTQRRCDDLRSTDREVSGATVSPVSLGDGTHVAVPVVLSLFIVLSATIGVVLWRQRPWVRFRPAYRSAAAEG